MAAGLAVPIAWIVLLLLFPEAPSSHEGNEHVATALLAISAMVGAALVLEGVALLGTAAAIVGLLRKERARIWGYAGLFANGILLAGGGWFLSRIFA